MTIGKTANATTVVTDANTAKAVGSGNLPVFSTPMMVALMEEAACNVLAEFLNTEQKAEQKSEQSSVGTQINVEHTAASPIGAVITASATITAVDGRKVSFDLHARDEKNDIGKGTHTRFIIDVERFMSNLTNKVKVK